jgi:hypothetical protein
MPNPMGFPAKLRQVTLSPGKEIRRKKHPRSFGMGLSETLVLTFKVPLRAKYRPPTLSSSYPTVARKRLKRVEEPSKAVYLCS